jgi:hypothetical protein
MLVNCPFEGNSNECDCCVRSGRDVLYARIVTCTRLEEKVHSLRLRRAGKLAEHELNWREHLKELDKLIQENCFKTTRKGES